MCGIAGFLFERGYESSADAAHDLQAMTDALAHRGPDGEGMWCDLESGVALGHRRLAILDLSEAGRQPMVSHDGRYVIVYNGEIYNFSAIRDELTRASGPIAWRGHSDTEIILEAIALWGPQSAVCRLNGMFALALWDRHQQELMLGRDRLGKKPLYYAQMSGRLAFASEVAALARLPQWEFAPDLPAIASYVRHGYVPGDVCAFSNVGKVPGGALICFSRDPVAECQAPMMKRFWTPEHLPASRGTAPADEVSRRASMVSVLREAVADRLVADVPVGALLSGGIDSTLVVAMAQSLQRAPIATFTVGFGAGATSEADHARAIARHLGTRHREIEVSPREVVELVPKVASIYDEPFGDASALPTYLISRLAAQDVKVALVGDGADELFGGYTRYRQNRFIWRLRSFPGASLAARLVAAVVARSGDQRIDGRTHAVACALGRRNAAEFYRDRVSHTLAPARFFSHALSPSGKFPGGAVDEMSIERAMMLIDLQSYLVDDILVKADRASMAVGLELRSPFLDDRVVDAAWQLPDDAVSGARGGKQLLKEILFSMVPRALVDRPKVGFGFPLESWLMHELQDWAGDLLTDRLALARLGLRPSVVQATWQSFRGGNSRSAGVIWNLICLISWYRRFAVLAAPVFGHRGSYAVIS